jgi:hypothetical protein
MEGTTGPPTQLTLAKAGMLAKVVKPATACREVNYNRGTVKIRDDSSSRDNRNIMDVICNRTCRTDSRKVSNSREQQYSAGKPATVQELTNETRGNSSRDNRNITDVNSRRETRKSKDARNRRD